MMELITSFAYWHWFIFAGILLILELLGCAGFLFWVGLAAAFTGVVLFFYRALTWQHQWVLFAIASVVFSLIWWLYLKKHPSQKTGTTLNKRSEQYIGKQCILIEDIINQRGAAKIGDSRWSVFCEYDLKAGTAVRVIAVDGTILIVVPIVTK